MDEDVIYALERELDFIVLHHDYRFQAYISVGLKKDGDYHVKLEFDQIDDKSFKDLMVLSEMPWKLKITSEVIDKHNYDIPQLLVITANNSSMNSCVWECLAYNKK